MFPLSVRSLIHPEAFARRSAAESKKVTNEAPPYRFRWMQREQLIAEGATAFRRDGFLLLQDVLDPSLIETLHADFRERHGGSGSGEQPRGSLRVGNRRYMVTVRLRPPFTDPRLFHNPTLLGALTELLGADRIIFSFGAVVSQPGSEDQHVHNDGGRDGLFGDSNNEGNLPPYAITVIVPLVDMDSETGTTRVWPGSHRLSGEDLHSVEPEDPLVRRGSALLMDYRLHHGGLANRSARPRPILSLVFTRPWFRDAVNFTEQPPLLYNALQRVRMPPELQRLLPPDAATSTERRAAVLAGRIVAKAPSRLRCALSTSGKAR